MAAAQSPFAYDPTIQGIPAPSQGVSLFTPPSFQPQQDVPEPQELPPGTEIDYNIHWSSSERMVLGRRLIREIKTYDESVSQRIANLQEWRNAWECMPIANADGPHQQSSDICSDATRRVCNNHHGRLNQQILGITPPVTAVAKDQDALSKIDMIEESMESILEECSWKDAASDVHQELPISGTVGLRITHERETRVVPRVRVEHDEEKSQQLAAAGVEPGAAYYGGLKTDRKGRPRRFLEFREVVDFEGIRLKVVTFEDLVILPVTVRDWEDAYAIGEHVTISGRELKEGARKGRYIQEEVDELLRRRSDRPDDRHALEWQHMGISPRNPEGGRGTYQEDPEALYADFHCVDLCHLLDPDDSGMLKWCRVVVHKETQRVLRLQYLPWEHGRPHYVIFPYLKRVNQLFAAGIAELMSGFQDADSGMLQQIFDNADIINNAFSNFMYDKSSGFNPSEAKLALGHPIPVDDVRGIQPIPVQPLPSQYFTAFQIIKDRIDLLTQSNNVSLGKVTDASRTLGEVRLASASADMQFEELASRVARVWADAFDMIRWLAAQFGDGNTVKYRKTVRPTLQITGTPDQQMQMLTTPPSPGSSPSSGAEGPTPPPGPAGLPPPGPGGMAAGNGMLPAMGEGTPPPVEFKEISADDLLANVDLVPTGLQQLSDMQSRVGQAQMALQTLSSLPLTAQIPEVQMVAVDVYLQAIHYPQRERVMDAIVTSLNAQAQQQMMQQQMMQQQADQQAQAQQADQANQQQQMAAHQEGQMAAAQMAAHAAAAEHGLLPAGSPPPFPPAPGTPPP